MAGIISNVDSDVQKLRKLKNEIEEVKKALKGINIKVDIDITKGLEVQLRSLSEQYDTVARKISEAEGKILISTKNINSASAKIIEAQEKLSKGAGSISQPIIQGSSSVSMAEVSNIQTQAKAYDELKEEIETVIGTRSQNIKRMMDEMNAIRLINLEIKRITRSQGESSTISTAQQKRLEQLNNSLVTHKAALSEVRQNLNNNVRMDNAAATSMNGLSQSLSRMRVAYRELTEDERKSKFGRELLASINQADLKIKELDATIGNHQRNVGNYGKQWNGLSMSIQQVGRELPSLAYGPKVFFSAISNNLPILADEIKRARTEYDLLKKSGQSATPVWKQIASSLFSWQSALTVGITLLTLYGDKMVNWVSGLIKAKNATEKLDETTRRLYISQRDLSSVIASSTEHSAHEITKLNLLYKIATDVTKSTKERNEAVKELKKSYPGHLKNLSDESIKNGEVSSSIKEQTNQIIANAKATAAADRIAQNWYKSFQSGVSKNIAYITKQRLEQDLASKEAMVQQLSLMRARPESYVGLAKDIDVIKKQINEADSEIRKHENLQESYRRSSTSLEKLVTVSSLTKDDSKTKRDSDTGKNAEKQAEELRKQTDRYKILLSKQALEQTRTVEDLQNSVVDERIKAMSDGSEKVIAQMEHNYEKEMQAIDRQKEDALRKKIEDARSAFEADPKNKGKSFNASGIALSDAELKAFDEKYKAVITSFDKENSIQRVSQLQMMWDYLKEYGTFQQKKLAIAEEYNEKIAKSTDEWQKKSLTAERDAKLTGLETEAIKANIDWTTVFSEFGGMFSDLVKPALEEAKKYTYTDKFKNSDQSSQKTLIDAINQMEKSMGGAGTLNFKKLGQDIQSYQNAMRALINAKSEEVEAVERLNKAQSNYEKAIKTGTESEKSAAKASLDNAQGIADAASANVKTQTNIVNSAQQNVSQTATRLKFSMENVVEGLSKMASGGIRNAYDGLIQAGKGMGGAIGKISKTLESVPIVGWILSIIDVLKDGLSNLVGNLIDSVLNAVSGIIKDVFSGDLFVTLFKSLTSGTGKVINALSFGLHGKIMNEFTNSNAKEVAATTNRLTSSNEILKQSIDALKDEMEKARGADTVKVYDEAVKKQRELIENTGSILAAQMGYHSSHHSNSYYIDKSMSREDWQRVSDKAGKRVTSTGELWSLSPEELKKVSTLTDVWDKIYNGGKYNKSEYLDQYLKLADTLEQLETQLQKTLTQTTFDEVYDNFVNTLMDMNKSAEDFANDLSKVFMKAMLSNMIGQEYAKKLEAWYKKFADNMKDGTLDDKEREALKNEYMGYVDAAIKERDELAKTIGYTSDSSSSQSATSKGFQVMSQDTGTELNGRFTALQIAGEAIKVQSTEQTRLLTSIDGKMSLLDFSDRVSQEPKMTLSEYAAKSASLSANVPDIAAQNRSVMNNSYQPQVNINFPTDRLDSLVADVATLKGAVEEMRDAQVIYYPNMVEKAEKMVKNIPTVNGKMNDINDNIKKAL